jgi:hypothetical protein
MSYDRDVQRARYATLLMAGVNAGMVIAHVLRREWWLAITAGMWLVSLIACFRCLQINQQIRDHTRIVQAMLNKVQQQNDQERRLDGGGLN